MVVEWDGSWEVEKEWFRGIKGKEWKGGVSSFLLLVMLNEYCYTLIFILLQL